MPLNAEADPSAPIDQSLNPLRQYCCAKPGADESMPWGPGTLGYKVADKLFAAIDYQIAPQRLNLKFPTQEVTAMIETHAAVDPHRIHKKHWISIRLDNSLPLSQLQAWIDVSYDLIFSSLSKKVQTDLRQAQG